MKPDTIKNSSNKLFKTSRYVTDNLLRRVTPYQQHTIKSDNVFYQPPNPRQISNTLCELINRPINKLNLSDFLWVWGDLIFHELILVPTTPQDCKNIKVPTGDKVYPQGGSIPFCSSAYETKIVNGKPIPQQINENSPYIDASVIYGNNPQRLASLRLNDGTGRLAFQTRNNGDFPIMNHTLHENDIAPVTKLPEKFFLVGNPRANQNAILTALHVLLLREHNRLCEIIQEEHPHMRGDDDAIFHLVSRITAAIMQYITYQEYLPSLLGKGALTIYHGYQEEAPKGITNMFASACFCLTPALIPNILKIPNDKYAIQVRDAMYNPELVLLKGIEPIIQGRYQQKIKVLNLHVSDEVRTNILYHRPNSESQLFYDDAAITIQRGRDHGLCDYNTAREYFGLKRVSKFSEITHKPDLQKKLASLYHDVNCIDPWVGALAENPVPGSQVGSFLHTVIKEQFENIRNSDINWYENDEELKTYRDLYEVTLSDLVKHNTILKDIPNNLFVVGRRKRHITRY